MTRWLLCLLLIPTAGAQIIGVEADVEMPVPFLQGVEQGLPDEICGDSRIEATADAIVFRDELFSADCAFYRIDVTAPAGSGHFRVIYQADRRVNTDPTASQAVVMHQEIHIVQPSQSTVIPVYPSNEGTVPMMEHSTPFIDHSDGFVLGWLFHDDGGAGGQFNPGAAQSFTATIRDASIQFPGVDLPFAGSDLVVVPDELLDNATSVRVFLTPGTKILGIQGGGGTLDKEPQGNVLVLTPADLARHGGRYQLDLVTPTGPASISPLHWLPPILIPSIGIIAVARTSMYFRGTRLVYRRNARIILIVAVGALAYALTLAIASLAILGEGLARLPLTAASTATYVQWAILLMAFVSFLVLASQRQLVAVQADLHRRERQREELLRSNKELEHFASVASHDLQEPLRKIAGFTGLLADDPNSPDAKQYADFAHDGATRMQRMVQDLLRYSRIGQQAIDRLPIDMDEVVDAVVKDLAEPVQEAGAVVRHQDLPVVHGAAGLIHQLMLNLIHNAIKYRHPERPPRIRVSGHAWPFETQIVVADNGRGIPKGQEEKVFQLFRRAHEGETGTGIGLALCARIVALHGGRIWVESDDKGSKFHFTIPREP